MAGALEHAVAAALGARPESLERRSLVDPGAAYPQHVPVPAPAAGVGVGDRAGEHLADGVTGRLWREREHGLRLVGGQPANQVHHPAGLPRRDADVPRHCPGFHHSSWVRLATAAPVVLDVRSESPRRRELAELVAHHRLGDEHRYVLPAVMHGDRVPQHRRDDHGPPGPGPDDGLRPLLVLRVHLLHQVVVDEGALLKATRHRVLLLPLVLAAATGDEPVAGLVCPPGPALRLAPRADRVAPAGALALAAAERVINGVHGHAAHGGTAALPPAPPGLAQLDVALLGVADLAHGGPAGRVDPPDLPGGHPQLGEAALLGQQLNPGARGPRDLRPAARAQLDGVHHGAGGDEAQRQRVALLVVRPGAVLHPVARVQALRAEDVPLLAVGVVQQGDPGRAVRVVFDVRDLGRHAVLVS